MVYSCIDFWFRVMILRKVLYFGSFYENFGNDEGCLCVFMW